VNTQSNCERHQDIVDKLFENTASVEEIRLLREHANLCADCAVQLEMHEHLEGVRLEDLESRVPNHMVEGMWPRVEMDIMRDDWRSLGERRRSPVWRWVVAAQAAAIVVLAGGAALLLGELQQIRHRETALAEKLTQQGQQLTALEWRTSRTGTGAVTYSTGGSMWLRRLAGTDDVTVAEVTEFLERLPEDSQVLGARDANRLLAQLPYAVSGVHGAALDDIHTDDGLQAGEALRLIVALDLDPSQQFPAGRIAGISKRYD
jgi:hypothetical protein